MHSQGEQGCAKVKPAQKQMNEGTVGKQCSGCGSHDLMNEVCVYLDYFEGWVMGFHAITIGMHSPPCCPLPDAFHCDSMLGSEAILDLKVSWLWFCTDWL